MNNFGLFDYISGGHREFTIRKTLLSAYADISPNRGASSGRLNLMEIDVTKPPTGYPGRGFNIMKPLYKNSLQLRRVPNPHLHKILRKHRLL